MNRIVASVFPPVEAIITNRRLKKRLTPGDRLSTPYDEVSNPEELDIGTLQDLYQLEMKRKDRLEDKAKTNVIGITIAVSMIMGANSLLGNLLLKQQFVLLRAVGCGIFILAVLFMIVAGIFAAHVIIGENEFYFIQIGLKENEQKNDYNYKIGLNRIKNTIRNNEVFTSYSCIRNALICLFIVLVVILVPNTIGTDNVSHDMTQVDNILLSKEAWETISAENIDINYIYKFVASQQESLDHGEEHVYLLDENLEMLFEIDNSDGVIQIFTISHYIS